MVQAGTRYWTGVWGNYDPSTPTKTNGNIYEKTPRPVLLNWLVSGNENATFAAYTSNAGTTSSGQIQAAGASISTLPSGTDLASSSAAVSPALSPTGATATTATTALKLNNQDAVLLVGPGTEGTAAHPTTSEAAIDRYVVAPLVPLKSASVPGMSGSQTVGRYAYWVGDEGVKARINLTDPYSDKTNASTQDEARYRLMTAPRTGMEVVGDFSGSIYAAHTQATTLSDNTAGRILAVPQASLLDSAKITGAKLAPRFHDFTTSSTGLLADTYDGGLRHDLTSELEKSTFGTWTGANGQSAGVGASIIPNAYSPYYNGTSYVPRWDVVRDFYHLYTDNQSSGAVPAQAAAVGKMGLAPELLQLRMIIGVNATSGQMIKGLFTPLLVLGNPYSTPLKLSGLKVQFWLADAYSGETWPNPVERMISIGADPQASFNTGRFMKAFTYESDTTNGFGSLTGAVTFTLPTVTLQPGEAKLFSLNNNYDAAAGTPVPLVAGEAIDFAGAYHYIYRTSTRLSPTTGGGGQNYKFTEGDIMTPVVVKILDSSTPAQTVLKVDGLNLDAGTNSYGLYWEPNGATNTDRIISAYNFDLGDPGVPSSLSDPALRTYTDFNPRAAVARRTNAASLSGAYFRYGPNTGDLATANTVTPSSPPTTFTSNLDPVEWGRHGQTLAPVLYDLPQGTLPVLSLGQLQQANLTADDIALNVGHQPALAVGNSYATPFLNRNKTVQGRPDTYTTRYNNSGQAAYNATRNYYDISYLLNTALWDGYFFSGVPQTGGPPASLNPRLELTADTTAAQASNGGQIAAHTFIKGAFNINSTSVDAWAAFLAGMRGLPVLPVSGATATATATASPGTTIFPRSLRQPTDALTTGSATTATSPSGDQADAYSGFRRLTDDQINLLAQAIVKQVRLRGPFVSLAHFVNRALIPAASDTYGLGFAGALQTAIDGVTASTSGGVTTISEDTSTRINNFANITANNDKLTIPASHTYYAETTATDFAKNASRFPQRSTGIPGWLTQADILQAVGPALAARSDTFVIRTYGDVINPVVSSTTPVARAWCEAVVQRVPDYVDSSISADTNLTTAPASAAKTTNQTFGRRFRVVSFRWLGPDDI